MRRPMQLIALLASAVVLAGAATLADSYFLGAGPGAAVPFEAVALPQVPGTLLPSAGAAGTLQILPLKSAFSPTLHQLLEGETVITTEKQMREVWHKLFAETYDASQFDFDESFVVLMGGGSLANGSFDISAVEQVQADFSEPGGPGGGTATESFLSLTATTFLPGVQPVDPPSATWRLSAVKIPRELPDDVVFRRNVMMGI